MSHSDPKVAQSPPWVLPSVATAVIVKGGQACVRYAS